MVVTPVSSDAALKIEDGTLVTYGKNQKYFRFDEEKIRALYNVTLTYNDGTEYRDSLTKAIVDGKASTTTNQNIYNIWKEGGTSNILLFPVVPLGRTLTYR